MFKKYFIELLRWSLRFHGVLHIGHVYSDYIIGNILEESIYDIWKSPENKRLRERTMRSYFDNEICKNCLFTTV